VARAYVGLGSNLGDRAATIAAAVATLRAEPEISVVGVSSLRETEPVGPVRDQPSFLNGAVALDTLLEPRQLLELLLRIELELGRTREGPRGGPRTIDLDLLLYDDLVSNEAGLTLPHPRLHERRFALEPLAELDQGLEVPGKGTVEALLARLH
jgi:2-amino-4-hydroxy-6-hydroxymethyldihydropteridine diphosphokinase